MVRVDVNKELKFCKNEKKVGEARSGGGGGGGGQGGCEQRIEVIVKMKIYSSFFIS